MLLWCDIEFLCHKLSIIHVLFENLFYYSFLNENNTMQPINVKKVISLLMGVGVLKTST